MKVPKALLIVVVIVLVVGVGSCGASVLRSGEGLDPDAIPGFLKGLMPGPPPVDPADVTTCRADGATGVIDFPTSCAISVRAVSGSVRRLELRNQGTGSIDVHLRDPAPPEDAEPSELGAGDVLEVDVPPDERLEIALVCRDPLTGCRVRVG